MKFPNILLFVLCAWLAFINGSAQAQRPEPYLVQATVTGMSLSAESPPDVVTPDGFSHALWEVTLVVNQVFKGPSTALGQNMRTLSAETYLSGNYRLVVPKLKIGDVGLWAIESMNDGSLEEVYTRPEVREKLYLPLIQGRHAEYEEVLAQWSRGEIGASKPPDTSIATSVLVPESAKMGAGVAGDVKLGEGGRVSDEMVKDDVNSQPGQSSAVIVCGVIVFAGLLVWIISRKKMPGI